MAIHLHRKTYKVRPSTNGKGLEITLPGCLESDGILKVGDVVEVLFDRFVVIVPPTESLDAGKLASAIEWARNR